MVATADENYELRETMYVPYARVPLAEMAVVVESAAGASAAPEIVRRAVREIDPGQPLAGLATVEQRVRESLGSQEAATRLMVGFGLFGLLLGALGIYGVLAYAVRHRRQELAIRQALGLTRRGATRLVLRRSLALALAGVAAGVPAALGFTRVLSDVLSGSTTDVAIDVRLLAEQADLDPGAYLLLALALAAAALLAAAVPAARAAATEPARALRGE